MRRPFICGNWKMHKTTREAVALAVEVARGVPADAVAEVAVAPVFTVLAAIAPALSGSVVKLAAQNCHGEKQGAFTGEVSAPMLRDVGCSVVILGHSERRQFFGETDAGVNKRARAALDEGLTPIVCVGETLVEREAGRTLEVVGGQLRGCLAGFTPAEIARMVVAYEPVWAIGTGKVATPAQAQEVHAAIRGWLRELGGAEAADNCRIQYGGSVKADNAAELLSLPDVDGALVGGASLKADEFLKIVAAAPRRG